MKVLRISLLSALLLCFAATTATAQSTQSATTTTEDKKEVTVKVTDLVDNQEKADEIRTSINNVEGLSVKKACTKSGTLTISYTEEVENAPTVIYGQLDDMNVAYTKTASCTAKGTSGKKCDKSKKCDKTKCAKKKAS